MTEKDSGDWPVTWEASRRAQRLDALRSTPEQRLARLEEPLRIAYESGALARLQQARQAEQTWRPRQDSNLQPVD